MEKLSLEGFASPEEMYRHVMENRQLMVEEYVVQHPKMMELYPYAVNTLRLVTVHAGRKGYRCILRHPDWSGRICSGQYQQRRPGFGH